jgi:hypothetical protein
MAKEKLKSRNVMKKFLEKTDELKKIAFELPKESYSLIKKLNNGQIVLDIDDVEIKNLATNISASSSVLAKTILISSFVLAMALILASSQIKLPQNILLAIFISILIVTLLAFILIKRRK